MSARKSAEKITELAVERWRNDPRVLKHEARHHARWTSRDKLADRAFWVRVMREEEDEEPVSAAFYPTHGGHGCDLMDLCLLSREQLERRESQRRRVIQLELFGGLA